MPTRSGSRPSNANSGAVEAECQHEAEADDFDGYADEDGIDNIDDIDDIDDTNDIFSNHGMWSNARARLAGNGSPSSGRQLRRCGSGTYSTFPVLVLSHPAGLSPMKPE